MDLSSKISSEPLNWYNCGPTIYNNSHLGHARTFLIFYAMIRYYKKIGYDITYCMNITDIDDKILKKVAHTKISNIIKEIIIAEGAKRVVLSWGSEIHPNGLDSIINNIHNYDYLVKWVTSQKFRPISINSLSPTMEEYTDFIVNMEQDFWEDMKSINVSKPDIVIRVSENISTITQFISTIIQNGYAYESNGSVYFDSEQYIKDGFDFSVLTNSDNSEHNKVDYNSEKKDPKDFALWKAAKAIDISFESPWGLGRPGWHIECSAMIHKVFGNKVDIHSGGIDLKFPHHNNEIVQTIAFNKDTSGTPKEFFHSGHIHIVPSSSKFQSQSEPKSSKMSQSLGNFITIKDYLKNYGTSRQLRLMCLMHKWDKELVFSDGLMEYTRNMDKRFEDFISHIQFIKRDTKSQSEVTLSSAISNDFSQKLQQYKQDINAALLNKFSTDKSIELVEHLIKDTYVYIEHNVHISHITEAYDTIMNLFDALDLNYDSTVSNSADTTPFVDTIVEIRDKLRDMAKTCSDKETRKFLFNMTDWIRDDKLKELNIDIEDRGMNKSTKWIHLQK